MEIVDFARRFKNQIIKSKLKFLVVLVICFIPMIYGFIFLSAFFNPYGLLNKLPVAIINMDNGSKKDNTSVNFGDAIVKNLKENNKVHWEFVSYNSGMEGLQGNKYYSVVIIPEDFSQNLAEVSTGKINKAHLIYQCNEKKNFIAVQISTKIIDDVMKATTKTISKESSKVVIDSLFQVKDGLKSASDGSYQINDGAKKLRDGSKKLTNGLGEAEKGSILLNSGLNTAANGGKELSKGMNSLITGLEQFNSAMSNKDDRINQLVTGSAQLSQGITTAKEGSIKLNNGLKEGLNNASDGITKLSSAIDEADFNLQLALSSVLKSNLTDAQKQNIIYATAIISTIKEKNINSTIAVPLKKAASSASPLVDGLTKLDTGGKTVANGTKQLVSGIETKQAAASKGISKLLAGANKLKTGIDNLSLGLNTASSKTGDLSKGLSKLQDGSNTLYVGLNKITDGSKKLSDSLDNGYNKINSKLNFKAEDMSEFISEPVLLESTRINAVNHYGEGFAPYFIPLALWVGCLVMFTLLDEDVKKYTEAFSPQHFVGKTLVLGALAAIQALLLSGILILILKLQINNLLLFFLFNIFLGFTFAVMFNSAIYLLGDLGRLILFLMLVLQLTSCGGTFPPELIPSFFNKISPLLPMTFSTAALREIISGIDYNIITHNTWVLAAFMSGYAAVSLSVKMLFAEKDVELFSKEHIK